MFVVDFHGLILLQTILLKLIFMLKINFHVPSSKSPILNLPSKDGCMTKLHLLVHIMSKT